tara:strand:- start:2648 stop:4210 length:1563 start_codon:yes stop_codon:yes gene_type:complete
MATREEMTEALRLAKGREDMLNYLRGSDQPRNNPESAVSTLKAMESGLSGAVTGATLGFADEIYGGAMAINPINMIMGKGNPIENYYKYRDTARKYQKNLSEQAPASGIVGDLVGSYLSGKGLYETAKLYGTAPKTVIGSAGYGAVEGGLHGLGRADGADEMVRQGLTGTVAGTVAGAGTHAVAEFLGRLNRGRDYIPTKRHTQAEELGIELTPAQKYEDRSLHRLEASMDSDPGYSKSFEGMNNRNQETANRIAARTIGINSNQLTDTEMGQATKLISDKFESAKNAGESVTLDDQWLDDIAIAEQKYTKAWGNSNKSLPIIEDALKATELGTITPKDYQYHYSRLGKKLDTASKQGDSEQVSFLVDMRKALDDVLDRSYPNLASTMQEARNLYKNKLLLQRPGVLNTATGDISPLNLANKLSKDIPGYVDGKNQSDLYNLARVSQNFKSGIGNSGTATRNKTAIDYMSAPIKESMGNIYLSGKMGTSLLGGTSGTGAKYSLPATGALLTPGLIDLWDK